MSTMTTNEIASKVESLAYRVVDLAQANPVFAAEYQAWCFTCAAEGLKRMPSELLEQMGQLLQAREYVRVEAMRQQYREEYNLPDLEQEGIEIIRKYDEGLAKESAELSEQLRALAAQSFC